jgi:sulfur-carrier protein
LGFILNSREKIFIPGEPPEIPRSTRNGKFASNQAAMPQSQVGPIRKGGFMPLQVFLAATLRKYVTGYDPATGHSVEVPSGATIEEVAQLLGIPRDEVKLILLDGIGSRWETVLQGNERLAFFPAVGGG